MLSGGGSTLIRNNAKINHTINYFLKREKLIDMPRWKHTYIHTLFTQVTLVLHSVLMRAPVRVAMGKDKG